MLDAPTVMAESLQLNADNQMIPLPSNPINEASIAAPTPANIPINEPELNATPIAQPALPTAVQATTQTATKKQNLNPTREEDDEEEDNA